ncbi:hypothetical protein [Rhodopila sp.]|uniref:hypothetical protein n=1 Tax=Rhodopila sp. TaxID=2480087 RepID=UPI003D0F93DE
MSDDQTGRILAIVERLEAGQPRLLDGLTKLEARQTKLEAGQTKLEAGQSKLEAGQAKLEAGQAKLEAGQAKLEETAIRQGDDLTRLRVDVMARMDRFQDSLTAIRDDISTNYGIADAAQRANDNTRLELRALGDVVSGLVRQIRRLDTDVRSLKGGDA